MENRFNLAKDFNFLYITNVFDLRSRVVFKKACRSILYDQ